MRCCWQQVMPRLGRSAICRRRILRRSTAPSTTCWLITSLIRRSWSTGVGTCCANRGAANLTEFLTGPAQADTPSEPVNLAVALVSPDGLRPYIVNWQEVILYFLRGVQADAQADGMPETAELLNRLLTFPDVPVLSEFVPPY